MAHRAPPLTGCVRRNPLKKPDGTIRWDFFVGELQKKRESIPYACVFLYTTEMDEPPRLLGGITARYVSQGMESQWVVDLAAAEEGWGPLLYDLMAIGLRQPLWPSDEQSLAALEFWERQPESVIRPLSHAGMCQKYGRGAPSMTPLAPKIRDRFLDRVAAAIRHQHRLEDEPE